jgi:hypothetical protein
MIQDTERESDNGGVDVVIGKLSRERLTRLICGRDLAPLHPLLRWLA